MKESEKQEIYESFQGLSNALSSVGIYQEQDASTPDEVKTLKSKVSVLSWMVVGLVIVMAIAVIAMIIDSVYFHIENSRDEDSFRETERNMETLKVLHPEFFNLSGVCK